MKRILSSIATLLLIPCLPLAFMFVSEAAAGKATKEKAQVMNQAQVDKAVENEDVVLDVPSEE